MSTTTPPPTSSPPTVSPGATLDVPGSSALPTLSVDQAATVSSASPTVSALGRSDSMASSTTSSSSPRRDPTAFKQHRARSRSPAPATTHSLSALHAPASPPPLSPPSAAAAAGSPALSPTGSGTALPSPARSGPAVSAAGAAFATRPAPVVPPSPSVPATPAFSRPTSPHRPASRAKDEPSSPVRGRGDSSDGATLSQSASQVDLNHIFERDVEFPTTHHITPSEAVDVAVPPVLTEAAVALSTADDDPIASRDLAALVLDAEQDAQANSGWSSPVLPPGVSLHQWHQQQQQQQQHHQAPHQLAQTSYANASRSPVRGMRSFSPDSSSAGRGRGRATSPGSSQFSAGTPPTSAGGGSPPPPHPVVSMATSAQSTAAAALGPFSQRLAEALENEASKLPAGLTGASAANAAAKAPSSSSPETSPRSDASSRSRHGSQSVLSPSLLRPFPTGSPAVSSSSEDPFAASPLASPSITEAGSSLQPPTSASSSATPTPASVALASAAGTASLAAPHPRKLSFATYADLVNEERLAELTGERLAPEAATPGGTGAQTPGVGPAGSGAAGVGSAMGLSRSRSGTYSSAGIVEQLETRLAAAGLGIKGTVPNPTGSAATAGTAAETAATPA
ncbi:hypothetical protein JCM3774_002296 [Rhodotorula dairenensis]